MRREGVLGTIIGLWLVSIMVTAQQAPPPQRWISTTTAGWT